MFGRKEKRQFVVMDGSDKRFVKEVIGITEMCVGRPLIFKKRKIKYQPLTGSHPTMLVFTIRSDYRSWNNLRRILVKNYPEQCVFGAPL